MVLAGVQFSAATAGALSSNVSNPAAAFSANPNVFISMSLELTAGFGRACHPQGWPRVTGGVTGDFAPDTAATIRTRRTRKAALMP
jgi:hypothetical protein